MAVLFCFTGTVQAQSALDGFNPNSNGIVYAIAVQPDGKILIGGFFFSLSPNGGAKSNQPPRRATKELLIFDASSRQDYIPNCLSSKVKVFVIGCRNSPGQRLRIRSRVSAADSLSEHTF
jgi:hypothetical protein